jgi:hypothetical protein
LGKYKDISIEKENLISNENMLLKEIDINLEETNIEDENEKITLKQYLNKTNKRVYLIAPIATSTLRVLEVPPRRTKITKYKYSTKSDLVEFFLRAIKQYMFAIGILFS